MIIDLHSHLVRDPATKSYQLAELLKDMEENGIEKRVISTFFGPSLKEANDVVIRAVKEYPDRLIGCAVINPKDDSALEEIERVLAIPEIKMIEFNSLEHGYRPEKWAHVLDPIFERCEAAGVLIKVFTGHGFYTMPEQWAYYSRRFPNLMFIILHMGGTDYSYGTVDLVKEEPNMVLEMSYETELQPLRRAFNEVSSDRLFYGSNYPDNFTDLSLLKYKVLELSSEVSNKLFYENAKKLLNL